MRFLAVTLTFLLTALLGFAATNQSLAAKPKVKQPTLELISVKKVWDKAPHNAFTTLVRYKGKWFMAFREAASHRFVAPTGSIRVLTSEDGETWESAALVKYGTEKDDLRDAKLSVTPEGRLLMVCALATPREGKYQTRHSFAYLSDDGVNWEGPHKVGEPNWWLWDVIWHDGTAYGLAYECGVPHKDRAVRLYRSKDGLNYETFLSPFAPQTFTNESTMLFRKDGSAVALLRRDGQEPNHAIVGTADDDEYKNWTFREVNSRFGGQQMMETPDGRHVLVVTRLYNGKRRTSVGTLDPETGAFKELLKLPATENSGGDTSYPGLVWHDGLLWISYYSHHAGKTRIYLAKVKVHDR